MTYWNIPIIHDNLPPEPVRLVCKYAFGRDSVVPDCLPDSARVFPRLLRDIMMSVELF